MLKVRSQKYWDFLATLVVEPFKRGPNGLYWREDREIIAATLRLFTIGFVLELLF
jgi:hypothetical protein